MQRFYPISSARRRLWTSLALLCLLGVFGSAAAEQPPLGHAMSPVSPAVPAPDFSLPDMDDANHALSDYRGRVVMMW